MTIFWKTIFPYNRLLSMELQCKHSLKNITFFSSFRLLKPDWQIFCFRAFGPSRTRDFTAVIFESSIYLKVNKIIPESRGSAE